jgi:O-antigen/teichoic acid export membrane protein
LLWLVPLGGGLSLIDGLSSTKVFTLRREVNLLPVMRMEFIGGVLGSGATIALAYAGYGIAATLTGIYVTTTFANLSSHFILPGRTRLPRAMIEPEAKREILRFGRWIFFSSALTAVIRKGDQLLLGRLVGASQLGIYQVALALSEVPESLASRVISSAVFPAMAQVSNQTPSEFGKAFYRVRVWLDALVFTAIGGLIGMSDWVIDLLYDDRYAEAGAMLRILAIRAAVQVSAALCENCFFAQGASQYGFRVNATVSPVLLLFMPIGHHFGGMQGMLWGTVAARLTALVVLWPAARARGFLRLEREAVPLLYLALGYGLGTLLVWLLPAV